jgi:hypothetical protein
VTDAPILGLLGEFGTADALLDAVKRTRTEGYRRLDTFTPYPVDGVAEALGIGVHKIGWLSVIGGAVGIAATLLLVSVSVIAGMWLERYMILVTTLYRDFLVSSWSHYTPTFWDWSTYFGTIGLFLVPFLLAIRFIPVISIFETEKTLLDAGGA